jgi:hypothetical protein
MRKAASLAALTAGSFMARGWSGEEVILFI